MDESEPTSTVPTKPTSTQPGGDVDIHTPATNGSSYADSPVVEGSYFKRTFSSLANIEFRFLWIGSLLTMGAMQMQTFARGFFVYDLTDSALLLGVVSAGAGAPGLLLSL